MTTKHYTKQLLISTILSIGLLFSACQSDEEKVQAIDQELCKAYDNSFVITLADDSIPEFGEILVKYLVNPLTYKYKLHSLSQRIAITQYADVKIYGYDVSTLMVYHAKWFMQYEKEGQTFYKELDDRGTIESVYKFKDDNQNYYLIVSVYNNGGGTVLRVLEEQGNEYEETNKLFPYEDLFERAESYVMNNIAFDPETNTISYNGYRYLPDSEDLVIGDRVEWKLSKEKEGIMESAQ